jgi:predicted regulator of Ras-like GTPase activity (Roadblock/LC7/MglB family)
VDELSEICESLLLLSRALTVVLLDEGQLLAHAGASADVSAVLAQSGGMARLLEDKEMSGQLAGQNTHVHLSLVAGRIILVVIFDFGTSLGLVRLRVKKATEELAKVLERGPSGGGTPSRMLH